MFYRLINKIQRDGLLLTFRVILTIMWGKTTYFFTLFVPPIVPAAYQFFLRKIFNRLPRLPSEFKNLPRAEHALYKLIQDFEFHSVLDSWRPKHLWQKQGDSWELTQKL